MCSAQPKLCLFNKLSCMHCNDLDLHLVFCVDLDLHIIFSPRSCLTWEFFRRSSLMGTTLRAAPSKSYAFSTNYHACIAMPTWPRCAPPILCWPWPPYNLFPRSCLTWIFFVNPHWWVPLYVQRPAKAMPFQQIIMHALHFTYQHDIDVHLLFCFDLDLRITCSWGRV